MADVRRLEDRPEENSLRFICQLSRFGTLGTLRSVLQGTVQVQSDSTAATFDLKEARFTYGTVQTWPHWPNPPVVEVTVLHAYLPRGAWLDMVEGLKPEAIRVPSTHGLVAYFGAGGDGRSGISPSVGRCGGPE